MVDQARALIDGPNSTRQTIPLRHLSLTPVKMFLERGATFTVAKRFTSQNVQDAYNNTTWAKKAAQAAKEPI